MTDIEREFDRAGESEIPPEVVVSIESALKKAESERREILAAIENDPPDPRAISLFRAALEKQAGALAAKRRALARVRLVALAAGLFLAVVAGWLATRDVGPATTDPGTTLSGSDDRLTWIAPKGRVKAFTEFRCQPTEELPSDTTFELVIVDLDPNAKSPIRQKSLLEPFWKPTPTETAALPKHLRATMRAFSPDGELLSSVVTDAQRID